MLQGIRKGRDMGNETGKEKENQKPQKTPTKHSFFSDQTPCATRCRPWPLGPIAHQPKLGTAKRLCDACLLACTHAERATRKNMLEKGLNEVHTQFSQFTTQLTKRSCPMLQASFGYGNPGSNRI